MSLPNDYATILNDLNRDVIRHRPIDALQFCADWFAARLRDERRVVVGSASGSGSGLMTNGSAPSPAANPFSPSSGSSDSDTAMASNSLFSSNPFGGAAASRSAPSADAGASAPGAAGSAPFQPPANFNFGRRTSVSAESMAPASSPSATTSQAEAMQKTVIPKSESQMQRIRASIQNNLLFRNLDEEQERDVLLAMKEVAVEPSTVVIRQGDQGDYFYVVESGSLDVYIKTDMGGAGGVGRGSTGSFLSSDSDGPASTQIGNTIAPGSDLSSTLGDRKVSYGPSDAFGELALLYLQPRAASIVSTSQCVLWALDRVTFRSILMETNSRKRAQLEKFLRGVHLFDTLDSAQLAKLADALQFREYAYGERIIEQGERGTEFFIVVDGTVSVRKRRDPSVREEEDCGSLITGEYFGELALLNNAPRAASIVAAGPAPNTSSASNRVKVAVLSESAFKRLVGSLASTMELHASRTYFNGAPGQGAAGTAGAAPAGTVAGVVGPGPAEVEAEGVDPHASLGGAASDAGGFGGSGRWVGGLGASPFAASAPAAAAAQLS